MLMDGDERKGILTDDTFYKLLQDGKIAFPSITEAEIEDRSKADTLAKGIAVLLVVAASAAHGGYESSVL